MDFIKKQGISFYLLILVFVLSIVSVAIYGANSANEYFGGNILNGTVITFTIFAIILSVAAVVLAQLFEDNKIVKIAVDICLVLTAMFLAFALTLFVRDRVYYLAIVYGSDLEKGNEVASGAAGQSIVGFVIYGITMLVSIAAAFFSIKRKLD